MTDGYNTSSTTRTVKVVDTSAGSHAERRRGRHDRRRDDVVWQILDPHHIRITRLEGFSDEVFGFASLLPSAFCLLPPAFCLLPPASCLLYPYFRAAQR